MKRALDSVIAALGRYPGETVDLLVGEPCFDPPVEIQRAFAHVTGEPASGYGPPGGLAELRKLLANWLAGERVNPDQVVRASGGDARRRPLAGRGLRNPGLGPSRAAAGR